MPFPFLDLPRELRDQIYNEALNSNVFREQLEDGYSRYNFEWALLRVNRQIYHEAKIVYLKNFVFVRIETPWDKASEYVQTKGRVPILTTGWQAEMFQDYSLAVTIDAPSNYSLDESSTKLLLLAEDLPTFCEMWFYSDMSYNTELNKDLSMTLRIRNPAENKSREELPIQVQERLFRPFGKVKRLRNLTIEGLHSQSVVAEMKTDMEKPDDSPEKCLEDATKLKDAGNDVLKKGDPKRAIEFYIQAFRAIHIVVMGRYRGVWGDPIFDRYMRDGPFDGQYGPIVRHTLRVRLVANIVKCLLDLYDWPEAEFWGLRTINLVRRVPGVGDDEPLLNFPAAPELGKIYYRTGVACKMQGKLVDARHLLQVAYKYLPEDKQVQTDLAYVCLSL